MYDLHENSAKTKSGIWEYEIERDTHQFGNIANVWSTFGIKEKADGIFLEKGNKGDLVVYDVAPPEIDAVYAVSMKRTLVRSTGGIALQNTRITPQLS